MYLEIQCLWLFCTLTTQVVVPSQTKILSMQPVVVGLQVGCTAMKRRNAAASRAFF